MRGRLSLLYIVGALLIGLFGGSAEDVLADERDEREVSGALAPAMFDPAALDFGDVIVGVPTEIALTFTNTTNRTLNFYSATGPYPDTSDTTGFDISETRACRNRPIYPVVLDPNGPNAKCTVTIRFTPRAIGEVTAMLTFYEYGSSEGYGVSLRGNGVSATPASTLSVAAARGPYRGEVALSATLAGCAGSVADRAVALTITTAAGSRTVTAITNASGIATAAAVPLTVEPGGVADAIPAGEYAPSAGWGVSASFIGGEGCAADGTAALTVERRTPTLTFATPAATTYGADPFALTIGSSAADDAAAPPLQLSYAPAGVCSGPSTPPATVMILGAGDCTITLSQPAGDNANYAAAAPLARTVTIARATPVLAWDAPSAITYGTPLGSAQLRATATIAGQFTYDQVAGTVLGAGSHDLTVLFTPTDSDNYTTVSGGTTLTVARAALTVTANAASRAYGADDPAFSAAYAGFVNGERASLLTGTLACASDATRLSSVGNGYQIACSGLAATNYTFDYRPGTLTITQAGSALALVDAGVVYGAATLDVSATLTAPGPLAASAATFAIVRGDLTLQSATASGIAGSMVSGTLPLAGLTAGDYILMVRYAGDQNVAPSEGRAQLRIAKASQAITFAPPTEVPLAGGAVQLVASASSGLAITFIVASDAPCAIAGVVLTPLRAGACAITAAQDGDINHDAAPSVSHTIQITVSPPPTATATPTNTPTATPPGIPVPSGTPVPSTTPAPARYTLTLTASAGGTVSASTPGPRYPAGTRLTLRATPAADTLFVGWTVDGMAQGWSPTLIVTLRADRRVEARFAPRPAFGDLATDTRAADPIAQLAARGIIKGYGDGAYGPADPILRAQMAALIVRALGWDGAAGGPTPFDDRDGVDTELWRAIGQLATRGIARGYGDGTYRPRDPVLHIQAVSFVTRALIAAGTWQPQPDDPRLFPDVPAASGHRTDLVTYLHYVGSLPGLASGGDWAGADGWEGPATRAWFAELLWRALDGIGREEREV